MSPRSLRGEHHRAERDAEREAERAGPQQEPDGQVGEAEDAVHQVDELLPERPGRPPGVALPADVGDELAPEPDPQQQPDQRGVELAHADDLVPHGAGAAEHVHAALRELGLDEAPVEPPERARGGARERRVGAAGALAEHHVAAAGLERGARTRPPAPAAPAGRRPSPRSARRCRPPARPGWPRTSRSSATGGGAASGTARTGARTRASGRSRRGCRPPRRPPRARRRAPGPCAPAPRAGP